MPEFWVASGHHLTRRRADGWLTVTDELLLAWLARPELVPPDEATPAERALHARLLAEPRARVGAAELGGLGDPDAAENWGFFLAFRDRLTAAGTVEAAYLAAAADPGGLPPIFLDQLCQLVLRSALEGASDAYTVRAGELFFRAQRARARDGGLVLADQELMAAFEAAEAHAPLAALLGADRVAGLDVMTPETAWSYWSRSDAHSMAIDLGRDARAREGLAEAIMAFLRHLLRLETRVVPVARLEDPDWRWFVGLDAEATRIGNALWRGEPLAPEAAGRVVALFLLDIVDPARALPAVAGRPVPLILAMAPDGTVRMKPQNLVEGLPLARPARVA